MKKIDDGPHVFVVGSARSGTSLCSTFIKSSPDCVSYHAESKLLKDCIFKYGPLTDEGARARFYADWLESRQYRRSGLDREQADALFDGCQDYYCFLNAVMMAMATQQGAHYWLDGTPDNMYVVDEIVEAFPNARIIHMIRDGRAVATSLARLGWSGVPTSNFDDALDYAAIKWEMQVRRLRDFSKRITDRYLEVRYEDLVTDPECISQTICDFLGISLIEVDSVVEDSDNNPMSTLNKPNSPFGDMGEGISSVAVDRWRKLLEPAQQQRLDALLGETLDELGYERYSEATATASLRLRKGMRMARMELRRMLKEHTPLGKYSTSPLEIGKD